MPPIIEVRINDRHECNTTTVSSACALLDQAKLVNTENTLFRTSNSFQNQQQKPHSLIGRFPSAPPERTTKPNPPVHIATVHYGEEPTPETTSKQVLIQQFYAQLEKMKAAFATAEPAHQMTTNTLTFDDGQVRQISASNQLKEKASVIRPTHCTAQEHAHPKPPVSKVRSVTEAFIFISGKAKHLSDVNSERQSSEYDFFRNVICEKSLST